MSQYHHKKIKPQPSHRKTSKELKQEKKVQICISKLLTLEHKDPVLKARVKIQKSIYKSIPKDIRNHIEFNRVSGEFTADSFNNRHSQERGSQMQTS